MNKSGILFCAILVISTRTPTHANLALDLSEIRDGFEDPRDFPSDGADGEFSPTSGLVLQKSISTDHGIPGGTAFLPGDDDVFHRLDRFESDDKEIQSGISTDQGVLGGTAFLLGEDDVPVLDKIICYDNETFKLTTFRIPNEVMINSTLYDEWVEDTLPERGGCQETSQSDNISVLDIIQTSEILAEKNGFEAPQAVFVNTAPAEWNTNLVPNEVKNSFRVYKKWLLENLPEHGNYVEMYESGKFSSMKSFEAIISECNYRNISREISIDSDHQFINVDPHSIRIDLIDGGWKTIAIPIETKDSPESYKKWVETLPDYKSFELYVGWFKNENNRAETIGADAKKKLIPFTSSLYQF